MNFRIATAIAAVMLAGAAHAQDADEGEEETQQVIGNSPICDLKLSQDMPTRARLT